MNLSIPANILPQHFEALSIVADDLKREFATHLVSIVVGGSVGNGTAMVDSDMDICVSANINWFQRRKTVLRPGVCIDLFIDPPARIMQQIYAGNHVFLRMYGLGWIAHDLNGTALNAKIAAKKLLNDFTLPIHDDHAFTLRNHARDILFDIHIAAKNDSLKVKYLLAIFIPWCVNAAFKFRRQWPEPEKRELERLWAFAPEIHEIVVALLSEENPISNRLALADDLYIAVFGDDDSTDIGPKISYTENAPPTFRVILG